MRFARAILYLALLMVSVPAYAQEGGTPQAEDLRVEGYLINETTGERGESDIDLMLHIWDANGNARGMLHGISGTNGTFVFEEVEAGDQLYYSVMASYAGATSFSEPVQLEQASGVVEVVVPIYETTADTSGLGVDLHYLIIDTGQGGLRVTELMALSNRGDRTIVNAPQLDPDQQDTLVFSLPEEAANVLFPSASPDRFRSSEQGFVDTQPIPPGQGSSNVVVQYFLAYTGSLNLERRISFDTAELSVLVPEELGLDVELPGAVFEGLEAMGQTARNYAVYTMDPLKGGASVELRLSGTIPDRAPASSEPARGDAWMTSSQILAWGAAVLGAAALIGGLILWKRAAQDDRDGLEAIGVESGEPDRGS